MTSVLQKIKDSLASKPLFSQDTAFTVFPHCSKPTSFASKLDRLRPKAFRRTSQDVLNTPSKISPQGSLKRRTFSKTDELEETLLPKLSGRYHQEQSLPELPVKGGSLYASRTYNKLKDFYKSLEIRRLHMKNHPVKHVDFGLLIRELENSSSNPKMAAASPRRIDDALLNPAHDRLNVPKHLPRQHHFSGRIYGKTTSQSPRNRDIQGTFLTTVPRLRDSYSISESLLPRSRRLPSIDKLESLKQTCTLEMTHKHQSNMRLSAEDSALQSKISHLKTFFEPQLAYTGDYVEDQIAEFRKEKIAFVYGKNFKGRYVKNCSKLAKSPSRD